MFLSKSLSQKQYYLLSTAILIIFTCILFLNAWVVDDAYITFRTVDNFTSGLGLTWNPQERVQVFTHPLWMFLVSFFYLISSELFFTCIILSAVLTLSSVLIAWKTTISCNEHWKGPLLILSLVATKAFIDYSSSGLENPLSYLIASTFLYIYLNSKDKAFTDRKILSTLFFLAALAFVNRSDTILLYIPALLHIMYASNIKSKQDIIKFAFIATLPATLWLIFSLIYYGYPFPNTAYAKALATEFPTSWKVIRGLEYLKNSIHWDAPAYAILCLATFFSVKSKSPIKISVIAGVILYIVYVIFTGASATHMSGRFFAVPLFISIIIFVSSIENFKAGALICVTLTLYIIWSPISALKFGTRLYQPYPQNSSYIDTKWYVGNEGSALINWRPGTPMPNNTWLHYGQQIKQQPDKVHIGGAFGNEAIGFVGFAAGPNKHFIDKVGLSDPLLGHLPAIIPENINAWKSGHFHRPVPSGYVESLTTNKNVLINPHLSQYYDSIITITRAPIFSLNRFETIIDMNLGRYKFMINAAQKHDKNNSYSQPTR